MRNKTMVKEKRKNRQIIVDITLKATTKHGETRTSLVAEGELVCSGKENILMH
jgi:predicted transcriptional regulator